MRGILAALALLMALPSAAGAAERFAAPNGAASGDCLDRSQPCDIHRAVVDAGQSGDTITLISGDYTIDATVAPAGARTIRGEPGQPRPNLISNVTNGLDLDAGSVLRAVSFRHTAENTVGIDVGPNGLVEDCALRGSGTKSQTVVEVAGGSLIRTTTIRTEGEDSIGIESHLGTVAVRNVTILGEGPHTFGVSAFAASGEPVGTTLDVVNTFIRAANGSLSVDVDAQASPGKPATVRLAHSNYVKTQNNGPGEPAEVVVLDGNQTDAPSFADITGGDFHERLGSATIDRGTAADQIGDVDIDGEARSQGAAPDIGADEFTVAPPPAPPSPPAGGGSTTTSTPPTTTQVVPARDDTAPGVAIGKLPRSLTLAQFKKGLLVELTPSEAAAFEVELRGTAGSVRLARGFDLILGTRSLKLGTGKRTVRLKPASRLLRRTGRTFRVRLQVTATDAARNRKTVRRTIKIVR